VSALQAFISRDGSGTGQCNITGVKIVMASAAFPHLALVGGHVVQVAAGTAGEISLVSGHLVASTHGERDNSLILDNGVWRVHG